MPSYANSLDKADMINAYFVLLSLFWLKLLTKGHKWNIHPKRIAVIWIYALLIVLRVRFQNLPFLFRLPYSAEIRLAIIEMHEMVNLTCNQVQQLERVP